MPFVGRPCFRYSTAEWARGRRLRAPEQPHDLHLLSALSTSRQRPPPPRRQFAVCVFHSDGAWCALDWLHCFGMSDSTLAMEQMRGRCWCRRLWQEFCPIFHWRSENSDCTHGLPMAAKKGRLNCVCNGPLQSWSSRACFAQQEESSVAFLRMKRLHLASLDGVAWSYESFGSTIVLHPASCMAHKESKLE